MDKNSLYLDILNYRKIIESFIPHIKPPQSYVNAQMEKTTPENPLMSNDSLTSLICEM